MKKIVLAFLILLVLGTSAWSASIITYQDGVSPTAGYTGTVDAGMLKNNTVSAALNDDASMILRSSALYERRYLVRFNLLDSIPSTATVQSAYIELRIDSDYGTDTLRAYGLKNSRAFTEGITDNSDCCWDKYAGGISWTTAGCNNTTTDRDGTALSYVSFTNWAGFLWRSWDVTALAQDWVDNDREENGIILIADHDVEGYYYIDASENATASYRPKLTINYTLPGEEIIRPEADNGINQWTVTGCAAGSHWDCVNEATADDNTSYIYTGTLNNKDEWTLQNPSSVSGTIDSVRAIYRVYSSEFDTDFEEGQQGIKLSSSYTWGVGQAHSTWTTIIEKLARPGGGSWTLTDLNNLIGPVNDALDIVGSNVYVTQYYVTIYYTPGAGKRNRTAVIEQLLGLKEKER